MVDRICISINNRCNLSCKYCHFHEKTDHIEVCGMDVFMILDHVRNHIKKYQLQTFKIGFVGNGEPLLDFALLKQYIEYISDLIDDGIVKPYTITNGLLVDRDVLHFFKEHNVNVGFSIDGIKDIHDNYRCNSFDKVMSSIYLYKEVFGKYPSMNCTIGEESLRRADEVIAFFKPFDNRITFSRMIGKYGISLAEFNEFLGLAKKQLNIRTGGFDCTMYGGLCGAGVNNYFYANGNIYVCGNCVDLEGIPFNTPLDEVDFGVKGFDRHECYRETGLT